MLDLREASKAPLVIRVCACVHACRYRCRNVQSGSSSSTASCWRTPEHWLSSFMSLKITTLSIHSKALYGFPSTSAAVHSGWNSQAPWEAGFTPLSHFTDGDTEAQRGKLIWPNAVDPGLPAPSSETCGHIVTAWRNQAGIRCHKMVVPGQGGCASWNWSALKSWLVTQVLFWSGAHFSGQINPRQEPHGKKESCVPRGSTTTTP